MSKRSALSSISESAANSRVSISGPSRVSSGGDVSLKPRPSLSAVQSRVSLGVAPPLTRRSSLGARKSNIQRGSSISSARFTDPRNIGDKQFMNNSIRLLVNYLTEHNFDHAISPKILTRPSNKDFNNIVLFLFQQIDYNFVCTGKFEDEVVSFFKQLGYPCQISKANISAAGTPHAWPSLLAGLVWLVELLNYDNEVIINTSNEIMTTINETTSDYNSIEDKIMNEKLFYNYLHKAYGLFLSGDDDRYNELETKFINSYETQNTKIKDQILVLELRNQSLSSEIDLIESRRAYLPELESKKQDYQRDLLKFEQLIDQLEKHKEQLANKTKTRQSDLEKLKISIVGMNEETEGLRQRIDQQELSPHDVRQMMTQKENLEQDLYSASQNKQLSQRRVYDTEQELREKVQELEAQSVRYNHVAESMLLVPETARNSNGRKLALEVDIRARRKDGLLLTDVQRDIVPVLQSMKSDLSGQAVTTKTSMLTIQEEVEELETVLKENISNKKTYEAKLSRGEEAYVREKEVLETAQEQQRKDNDLLEARLVRLKDTSAIECRTLGATRRISEARTVRDTRAMEHSRRKREAVEAIVDAVTLCAAHREDVSGKLMHLKEQFSSKLERCLLGGDLVGDRGDAMFSATRSAPLQTAGTGHRVAKPHSSPAGDFLRGRAIDLASPPMRGGYEDFFDYNSSNVSVLGDPDLPPHPPRGHHSSPSPFDTVTSDRIVSSIKHSSGSTDHEPNHTTQFKSNNNLRYSNTSLSMMEI